MSKELEEAWITIYHYNDEIIHDMGSEYIENPLEEEINIVNNALLELKAIKEATPSEALRKLDDISYLVLNEIDDLKNKELWKSYFTTIKQALLKAQEPKQYLKWEDLEFKEETHKIRILMNDNLYNLVCFDKKYIEIFTIKGEYILSLDNENPEDKQFFNDLHLEVVE